MARPKKNIEQIEKEIMKEMTEGNVSQIPKENTIAVLEKPEDIKGANEFGDTSEYTIQVIADNGVNIDPTILPKKDPNFEYYFIRDDHKNIAKKTSALLYQMGGWQIVPKEHSVNKLGIDAKMLAADGSYRIGELILTFMPKRLYAQKKAEEQRKTNERMGAVNRMLQEGDPEAGILAGKMDGGRVQFGGRNKGISKGPLDKG